MVFFKLVESFDIFAIQENKLLQDGRFQFKVRALQVKRLFWYTRLNRSVPDVNS